MEFTDFDNLNGTGNVEWLDKRYEELLEDELRVLERRSRLDGFMVEELEGTLRDLYIREGADWEGRGSIEAVSLGATIAAYELFIERWKKST
jgi:hypothetical protein